MTVIVEVIAVGTELLLGQIVNGNGATIGARLAEAGLDAHFQQVVGDNPGRMEASIRSALARADAVILTGGIGPTQDDITREAICAATGRRMLHSEEYEEQLRRRWEALGRVLPISNLRQADYPEGAEMLANPKGTAPGIALEHEGKWIFAVPGVPEEMTNLLDVEVLPRLRTAAGLERVVRSRVIRSWGLPESKVAEMLADLYEGSTNPSIAFLASSGEIKVRITAAGSDQAEVGGLIAPVEQEVRNRLGSAVFGADEDTIEVVLHRLLSERGWTIGTAESATAGLVSARLAAIPGASKVLRGGIVAYAEDLKLSLLSASVEDGVVSEAAAISMAEGARAALAVDVAIAVTGAAGPDPLDKPPGTMVVAVATPDEARARTLTLPGDRERIRTYTATAALHLCRLALTGVWWG